jgi:hypothetical protein
MDNLIGMRSPYKTASDLFGAFLSGFRRTFYREPPIATGIFRQSVR